MRIDVFIHSASEETNKLDAILKLLQESKAREEAMSQEMDALKVVVANTKAGVDSAIVFINGIVPQITDAAGDKEASLALAAELTAKTQELAVAMAASGTQPAPPPGT